MNIKQMVNNDHFLMTLGISTLLAIFAAVLLFGAHVTSLEHRLAYRYMISTSSGRFFYAESYSISDGVISFTDKKGRTILADSFLIIDTFNP